MKITYYTAPTKKLDRPLRIAVAADLHNNPHAKVIEALCAEAPDLILIPGDLMDNHELKKEDASGYDFLRSCVKIAPTYYSLGNHELGCYHKGNPWRKPFPEALPSNVIDRIAQTGAVLLDNTYSEWNGIFICGLTSGIKGAENKPDSRTLAQFSALQGYRILLCHHPEYFIPYVEKTDIDLTLCGHAHGGHWRFFGRGVYAPGQGLFPKYTAGNINNRCFISRGLGNHTKIPRICNPTELLIISLQP